MNGLLNTVPTAALTQSQTLVELGLVVVLAAAAPLIGQILRLPSILVLLALGFGAGAAGALDPNALLGQQLISAVVSVAVGIILFEAGLDLKLSKLTGAVARVSRRHQPERQSSLGSDDAPGLEWVGRLRLSRALDAARDAVRDASRRPDTMASASSSRTERHERIRRGGVWARARRQWGRLFDFEEIELSLHAAEPLALGLCPACRWGFVTPVRWEPLDGGSWRISLRCNACGQPRDTVAGDRLAQRFAAAVTASAADIEQSLHCPEPHCMERWRAAFADALARDLIEPGDFDMEGRCHG